MVKYILGIKGNREEFHHEDPATGWGFIVTVVDVDCPDELKQLSARDYAHYLAGNLHPVVVYANAVYCDSLLGLARSELVWMDSVSLQGSRWLGQKEAADVYHEAIERSWSKIGNLLSFAGMADLGERVKTEAALL